jgi:hypothetical protein
MNKEITATPESFHTSTLTPITLSEGQHVQMSFVGRQVDNPSDKKKNIRGKLVIKKKRKDDDFSDETKFSKKDIHVGDFVEIDLDTAETFELGKGLYHYYQLFSGKSTNPYAEVAYVEKDEQYEKVKSILQGDERLAKIISEIDTQTINAALNIENLKRIRDSMQGNMDNDQETAFWQPFFENNAWIISQLFHAPVMFFKGKRYVGGKGMDDHGGQYTDLIFKNDVTDNIALVEIKTPVKPIIDRQYRQSYTFKSELVGGINQLLLQKDTLAKEYFFLLAKSETKYRANNIECILIYGNVGSLRPEEKDAFESYRNELRTVRIIGFDELLQKVNNLLALFENKPDNDDEDTELPF